VLKILPQSSQRLAQRAQRLFFETASKNEIECCRIARLLKELVK
jgi:hypothetical protein